MPHNIHGGGSQTNINGLAFESGVMLRDSLLNAGFTITDEKFSSGKNHSPRSGSVFFNSTFVGKYFVKHGLYADLLAPNRISWKEHISKQLLPDDAFFNCTNDTLYIIEKKFQATDGSVDEKLATFHFKCQEYEKLVRPLGLAVHFIYVLSEWYNQSKYNDYFSYMEQLGCEHYFAQLPLTAIGL